MRLATVRRTGTTSAARVDSDDLVLLPFPDVAALLAEPRWRKAAAAAGGERLAVAGAAACIAGYTVVNDISMRDWQWRGPDLMVEDDMSLRRAADRPPSEVPLGT